MVVADLDQECPLPSGGLATVCCGCRPPSPHELDSWERQGSSPWFEDAVVFDGVFAVSMGNADFHHGGFGPISVYLGLLDMLTLEWFAVIGSLRRGGGKDDVATVLVWVHQHFVGGAGGIIWYIGPIGV